MLASSRCSVEASASGTTGSGSPVAEGGALETKFRDAWTQLFGSWFDWEWAESPPTDSDQKECREVAKLLVSHGPLSDEAADKMMSAWNRFQVLKTLSRLKALGIVKRELQGRETVWSLSCKPPRISEQHQDNG